MESLQRYAMFLLLFCLRLLLPLFLLFFVTAATSYRKGRNYKLPPGPKPLPIIGNLLNLRDPPHISFQNLSKLYGPLVHLKLGQIPVIIASSKEHAIGILKTQDLNFCNRPQTAISKRLSYNGLDIAFSPSSDHWKTLRMFINAELFCTSKVQAFQNVREEEIDILMSTIRRESSGGKEINMSDIMFCLFNNITYRRTFGRRLSKDGECGSSPHHESIVKFVANMGEFNITDIFPSFWWLDYFTGNVKKVERTFGQMDGIFEKEIEERLARNERYGTMGTPQDFLDVLLLASVEKHPSIGFLLSRDEIKALLMNLFLGGSETSSVVVVWGLTELMRNKSAMKKAQDEIRKVVGNKGRVEEDDLKHFHYLKLVIKETLRLHNPAPLLAPHECIRDTKISNYDIPAKTWVIINIRAISRDPQLWENPEVFDPERFENSSITYNGNHFVFIPFGSGRRICPGMTLGIVNVEIALANLLYGFEWKSPYRMDEKDIDMQENLGIVAAKKIPLKLLAIVAQVYE